MEEKRNACRVSVGNQIKRDHQEDLDGGGSIILTWILETKKHNGTV
jgi:hypothetical protein